MLDFLLRAVFSFRHLPGFHVFVLCFYYLFQGVFGFYVYDFSVALDFFLIFVFAIFVYVFVFMFLSDGAVRRVVNSKYRFSVDVGWFSFFVFLLYVVMVVYVAITSDQVALFQAFQGASVSDLAESRERFLRTREGWEAALPYVNAVLVMALLPYSVASLFYVKNRFRFIYIFIFLVCLSLTLEKSLAVLAFLPVVVIAFNGDGFRGGVKLLIVFLVFLAGVSFLARGGLQGDAAYSDAVDSAAKIPDAYKLFDCDEQACYLANRVLWIPYATAIDWLKYHEVVLNGNYVFGSSTSIGASLLGVKKLDLEKDVFNYQWGQNETGTGSSNVAYFIDAYVNFSWLGVFAYALIVALIVKMFYVSDNIPVKAVSYASLFYLSVNSLPPMLSSGGLMVIVIICLFFRPVRSLS